MSTRLVDEQLVMGKPAAARLVTSTDAAPDANASPIERTGIAVLLEHQFSVHKVRRFKPAPWP